MRRRTRSRQGRKGTWSSARPRRAPPAGGGDEHELDWVEARQELPAHLRATRRCGAGSNAGRQAKQTGHAHWLACQGDTRRDTRMCPALPCPAPTPECRIPVPLTRRQGLWRFGRAPCAHPHSGRRPHPEGPRPRQALDGSTAALLQRPAALAKRQGGAACGGRGRWGGGRDEGGAPGHSSAHRAAGLAGRARTRRRRCCRP